MNIHSYSGIIQSTKGSFVSFGFYLRFHSKRPCASVCVYMYLWEMCIISLLIFNDFYGDASGDQLRALYIYFHLWGNLTRRVCAFDRLLYIYMHIHTHTHICVCVCKYDRSRKKLWIGKISVRRDTRANYRSLISWLNQRQSGRRNWRDFTSNSI